MPGPTVRVTGTKVDFIAAVGLDELMERSRIEAAEMVEEEAAEGMRKKKDKVKKVKVVNAHFDGPGKSRNIRPGGHASGGR